MLKFKRTSSNNPLFVGFVVPEVIMDLDRLKKARTPVRGRITRTVNEVEAEVMKTSPGMVDLEVLLRQLDRVQAEIEDLDQKILNGMLDSNCTDQEYESESLLIEEYQNKIARGKCRIERVLNQPASTHSPTGSYASVFSSESPCKKKTFKLPKIQIPKFDGELKNWLGWWSQFEKIHSDEDLHDSDKFQYLIQATDPKTEARSIISAYPPTGENYDAAVESLRRRYGREGLQLQVYLRELLSLVIANVTAKEKISLDVLYLKLQSHLRALDTLDLSKAEPSMYFYPLVESSLPADVLRAWLRCPAVVDQDGNPSKNKLQNLMSFLEKEVEGEQQISLAQSGFLQKNSNVRAASGQESRKNKGNEESENPVTAAALYSGEARDKCIFCGKTGHQSQSCFGLKKMSPGEKIHKIKEAQACYKCLKKGHRAKECRSSVKCGSCGQQHYKLLCPVSKEEKAVQEITAGISSTLATVSRREKIVLRGTMHVKIMGPDNKPREVRALIDSGSDVSYIKGKVAESLKLKPIGKKLFHTEVFGGGVEIKERKEYLVRLHGVNGGREDLNMFSENQICGDCAPIPQGPWIKELIKMKVFLSDTYADSAEIDVLIGSNHIGRIITGKIVKLNNSITATETSIGWYLNGEVPVMKNETLAARTIAMMTKQTEITALWELDALGIRDNAEKISKEEQDLKVKEEFQKELVRAEDGRYVAKLPWVSKSLLLPNNRFVAEKRLQGATNKLILKNEFQNYDNIFRAWEAEGIIEEVGEELPDSGGHYLPHRPVFKPESLTTPVRPVYDASCKIGSNPSLNQCLEKGPNMLEVMLHIILRFRKDKVGAIADIRKAFQMIDVNKEDRKFQRFLWWKDEERRIFKIYQHCRVVFGMNCSPFILAAVLEFHLKSVPEEERETSENLLKALYVDNCVKSFPAIKEYELFKEESTLILSRAKMDLRQWESNVDEEMEQKVTSVLGYKWDKKNDELYCSLPKGWGIVERPKITKRSVLSLASQVFDPIGFTSPAVLQLKILLQESWAQELKWDKEWDESEKLRVEKWCSEMQALGEIKIPRWAVDGHELQLHAFGDASRDAFGGVVFVRSVNMHHVNVQLLMAKSRVSPLYKKENSNKQGKRMTIPRGELMGCYVAVKLADTVKKAMGYEDDVPTIYWSDSTTALAWIERDEDWGTFVGNRVRNILKLSRKKDWRHVPGKMNPADLPSRGCSPTELLTSKWWEGPSWLRQPESEWPRGMGEVIEEEVTQEKRKNVCMEVTATKIDSMELKFTSYQKNIRILTYAIRMLRGVKFAKLRSAIKLQELRDAEMIMWRVLQQRYFPNQKKIQVRVESIDGLLRVKSKLEYKQDMKSFRLPILLPKDCPLVQELIREVHRENGHAGIQFTLNKLREKYWIPQSRRTVTMALRKCVVCKRHQAKPLEVNPVALPEKRVTPGEVFITTGVDLAGPLFLKNKSKVWIVLYTCAVYRCVVLDLVDSLDAPTFIRSLQRFVSTHGRPNTIYSDNGTNFVGAENLFQRLNWKKIEAESNAKKIQWIFNPATASWWGGWWERLVGSVKGLLKRMLGRAALSRDELATCLAVAAATINERPLTTITEDDEDLIPLTPSMFMKGTKMTRFPEAEYITGRDLQVRFKYIKNLQVNLQTRFRKEYLGQLVQKKHEKRTTDPKVGDIVLVGADNKKRWEWPLGRIVKLNPGKDGEFRSAVVKTSGGILSRPLQRLYPLEVSSEVEMPKPELTQDQDFEEDATIDESDQEEETEPVILQAEPEVVTKAGRQIKKPSRYSAWSKK